MKFLKKWTFYRLNVRLLFESGTYLRAALNGARTVLIKKNLFQIAKYVGIDFHIKLFFSHPLPVNLATVLTINRNEM